ncbi:unnamed protein product [Ectocarpus sp. CCAP 1310/34]|nr:unnamed protein product [Ectocarpus sp. CCAP 1310/34]
MAGDASLGITPVMKWNFERSCYRWLVTRHPAQFERLDFTAQILQSASRARKAFYECGWAEAKVLIRPSDGKFERTPFFDAIIRRGLRNSTRFDAATLTEDEIEALGMHRDETLGFKLQIRHFRSSRKELPPQGRGGGAVRKAPLAPLPPPPPQAQAHRHGGGPAAAGARHLLPPSIAPPPTAGAGNGRDRVALLEQQQQQQRLSWGAAEAVAVAAAAGHPSGDLRWADEARWHHAAAAAGPGDGAVMDGGNSNNGGGGGERWAAWDGGNRWMPGEEGSGANVSDGHRLRHTGHATPPLLPGLVQAPSPAAAGVTASRRSAAIWEGAPHGGGWVGDPADMRQQGSLWHPSGGASGAGEGRGQGYDRTAHSGMGEGAGVARVFAGNRRQQHQQPEVDVRGGGGGGGGGLRFHPSPLSAVEHHQRHGPSTRTAAPRVVGGSAVPAPSFRHGAVGVDPAPVAAAGGTSADPSSVAAGGSLLFQGYRRLAAMADEQAATAAGGQLDLTGGRRRGGAHPPAPAPAAVLNRPLLNHSPIGRPLLPHEYDAAVAERDTDHHKRSASSLVGAGSSGRDPAGCSPLGETGGPRPGQASREPPFSSLAGGGDPAAKRRRSSVDEGDLPFGGVMQQQQQQQQQQQVRGRSTSNERLPHGNGNAASWTRGASGLGMPPPPATALVRDDVLARELEESERELLSSRVAVDLAQARYEEASRTHHAKREQVLAAAAAEHQKQLSIAGSHHHQGQEQQQQQQQQQTATLKGGASRHSLARSSEVAAETSAPNARATAGAGTGDSRHSAANDGRGSGSEEGRNGDADAAFHHRNSLPLGRRSPAASGRSERPSESYGRSPSLEALGAGPASPVGKVSSSPSPSAAGQAQPDCADEMMEVKLEAALLCGMGRAPVSSRRLGSAAAGAAVTPSPKAVTAGAEKGLEIVSLAAAAASAVPSSSGGSDGNVGVPPRSSSSSPGGIRRDLSERTHSPLPSLPWKGHHNHHNHHNHHRSAMGQAPGSPSACGETDSDHSSDRGCAAVEDLAWSKKQQHHELQGPVVPRAVGRGGAGRLSWADYGDGGGDRRALPLAKRTADVLV